MEIDNKIIELYERGWSLKQIANCIFFVLKKCPPKNFSFLNTFVCEKENFVMADCILYVSKVIFNYNLSKKK